MFIQTDIENNQNTGLVRETINQLGANIASVLQCRTNVKIDRNSWVYAENEGYPTTTLQAFEYEPFWYKVNIPISGVTEKHIPVVMFAEKEALSGNYVGVVSSDGFITIWSRVRETITIPMIGFIDAPIVELPKTYTMKIVQTDSNPLSCCHYFDDAEGMTKGSSEWDEIFGYKPCVFYNGEVYKYLNPNDFTKFEDGTSAINYISGTSSQYLGYDVMIEFPRMGLNISTDSNDIITIKLTPEKNNSNFQYLAHKRGDVQKDYFYLGAYAAYNGIRSKSGVSPIANNASSGTQNAQYISNAHNRGTGYEIMAFYQLSYIQALYVMKYGNLNSKAALGLGYTYNNTVQKTGATNTKGMCYGNKTNPQDRVKLFGMEDFWGNVSQSICGISCRQDGIYALPKLQSTTDNFDVGINDTWEKYKNTSISDIRYMKVAVGTNEFPFITEGYSGGSSTTYYTDYSATFANSFAILGSNRGGIFNLSITDNGTQYYINQGTRLMFL